MYAKFFISRIVQMGNGGTYRAAGTYLTTGIKPDVNTTKLLRLSICSEKELNLRFSYGLA